MKFPRRDNTHGNVGTADLTGRVPWTCDPSPAVIVTCHSSQCHLPACRTVVLHIHGALISPHERHVGPQVMNAPVSMFIRDTRFWGTSNSIHCVLFENAIHNSHLFYWGPTLWF